MAAPNNDRWDLVAAPSKFDPYENAVAVTPSDTQLINFSSASPGTDAEATMQTATGGDWANVNSDQTTVPLPAPTQWTRALMIATGGTLKVLMKGGQTVTLTVPAGEFRIRCAQVFATGTSATGIVALW